MVEYNEIIEVLTNYNYGGEYDCAIENHMDVLKKYKVEYPDLLNVCEIYGDEIINKCYFDEFLHDYYKSVIKSVINVLKSFKEDDDK